MDLRALKHRTDTAAARLPPPPPPTCLLVCNQGGTCRTPEDEGNTTP